MTLLEAILIAIALAMDCFTVSFTCGIIQKKMGMQSFAMACMFGFFQTFMTFLGWFAIGTLSPTIHTYDHWVVSLIFFALGGKMIWDGIRPKESHKFNPSKFLILLMLSLATSVDALAIGCSFVGMGLHRFYMVLCPMILIGIASFVLTLFGKYAGVKIGHKLSWPAEQLGGLILISIGLKVILQQYSL